MNAGEVEAESDGDVFVVLDLRVDSELIAAGVARELVNRCVCVRVRAPDVLSLCEVPQSAVTGDLLREGAAQGRGLQGAACTIPA
jgi:hypothetical protein